MANIKTIVIAFFVMLNAEYLLCQITTVHYEKTITEIEFYQDFIDTTVHVEKYDINNNIIEAFPAPVEISYAVKTESIKIDEHSTILVYSSEYNPNFYIKEVSNGKEEIMYHSDAQYKNLRMLEYMKLNNEGLPMNGFTMFGADTIKLDLKAHVSLSDFEKIERNLSRDAGFLELLGHITFHDSNFLIITDFEEGKNKSEVKLNAKLRPIEINEFELNNGDSESTISNYKFKYINDKLSEVRIMCHNKLEKIITYSYSKS